MSETLSSDLVAALERAHGDGIPQEITRLCQLAADEIKALRSRVERERQRTYSEERISYMGFSYGMGSQWGVDSLRRAINANQHY